MPKIIIKLLIMISYQLRDIQNAVTGSSGAYNSQEDLIDEARKSIVELRR